ncbi:MAG TPA: hypothetical protein VJ904_09940, partial [Tichowtungia sp.]|nr:hypothetical protein [Tichowtungia sp.]
SVFGVGSQIQPGDFDLFPDGDPAGAADPQMTSTVLNPLLPPVAVLFPDVEHSNYSISKTRFI